MNILLISDWGGSLALGLRFLAEGHEVRMWIKDENYRNVGDGLVVKVPYYEDQASWADFILVDDGHMAEIADRLRTHGKPVWGGTPYSDKLESDRGFGQEEMSAAGMTILPHFTYTSLDEGIDFVKKNPGRYVFKPDGKVQEDKILTYVGRSEEGEDLLTFMEHLKRRWSGKVREFELQQFKSGVEIGVSGFFNGNDFVEPIEISFEHKKLMTGDIGPATFEMGTTMFWTNKASRLYLETIAKMRDRLQGYVGYFDINCIAYQDTLYPLEVTSRFGYPTIFLKMETLRGNLGEQMCRIARGEACDIPTSNLIATCVVIATPPWPYDSAEVFHKYGANTLISVKGAGDGKLPPGIYPAEVRYEDGDLYTAGRTGFSLIATGSGDTIEKARKLAYDRASLINIPNMMFRTDIGSEWQNDMAKLQEWKWI